MLTKYHKNNIKGCLRCDGFHDLRQSRMTYTMIPKRSDDVGTGERYAVVFTARRFGKLGVYLAQVAVSCDVDVYIRSVELLRTLALPNDEQ